MTEKELENLASNVLSSGVMEELKTKEICQPEVEENRLPTHEELHAQGINIPDWVPVEDVIWDDTAEIQQQHVFSMLIDEFRRRKARAN